MRLVSFYCIVPKATHSLAHAGKFAYAVGSRVATNFADHLPDLPLAQNTPLQATLFSRLSLQWRGNSPVALRSLRSSFSRPPRPFSPDPVRALQLLWQRRSAKNRARTRSRPVRLRRKVPRSSLPALRPLPPQIFLSSLAHPSRAPTRPIGRLTRRHRRSCSGRLPRRAPFLYRGNTKMNSQPSQTPIPEAAGHRESPRIPMLNFLKWRYGARVSTRPSQGRNPGSNPGIATKFQIAANPQDKNEVCVTLVGALTASITAPNDLGESPRPKQM